MPWNFMSICQGFWQDFKRLWTDPLGSISLSVTTLFWGVGATLQLLVLSWAQEKLLLNLSQAAYLQAATAVGVIAGAALAARWVALHQATWVLGLGLAMGALLPIMLWVTQWQTAVLLTTLLGLVGGFFVVPMNALLQHRGVVLLSAGRSIAIQNVNENASILAMMAAGSNSLLGIGPMIPKWLRVGFMNTGMAPVMMIECKMDLWQLRSTTTTSPGATVWCQTILLEVLVPLVTKKQWSALTMRAALRSLSPMAPLWSSNWPNSSTAVHTSARSMFSP
jgi:hypothetical protein